MARRSLPALCVATALLAACASPRRSQDEQPGDEPPEAPAAAVPLGPQGYLQPNAGLDGGKPGYIHPTEADMPWRVSIGYPKSSPHYGSRRDAREAAIEAMRMWETAIQPTHPWFRLAFVENDRDAPVQVEWVRRLSADAAGRGGVDCQPRDLGTPRVGGVMRISTTPDLYGPPLSVDEVRMLVAHEFGHVLGLGHCLDCDSAMNYSWQTRERVLVTPTDVQTVAALFEQPDACSGGE